MANMRIICWLETKKHFKCRKYLYLNYDLNSSEDRPICLPFSSEVKVTNSHHSYDVDAMARLNYKSYGGEVIVANHESKINYIS